MLDARHGHPQAFQKARGRFEARLGARRAGQFEARRAARQAAHASRQAAQQRAEEPDAGEGRQAVARQGGQAVAGGRAQKVAKEVASQGLRRGAVRVALARDCARGAVFLDARRAWLFRNAWSDRPRVSVAVDVDVDAALRELRARLGV